MCVKLVKFRYPVVSGKILPDNISWGVESEPLLKTKDNFWHPLVVHLLVEQQRQE